MTLSAGEMLGPYEIQALTGAGGMGEVYRARDTRLDRIVAIKLLSAAFADRPDRRLRFQHEAHAISSLQHPHICTLFDIGEQDGQAFLVMEYLVGETLDDRLTRGPLPAADVLLYASQIAGALDHAHRAHVVHRDLKPSNVMLTPSGAKLLDFGLAGGPPLAPPVVESTMSFAPGKLTAEGTIVGTFQYMAPEQLEGKPADARTDIFAFGTLLYEMATSRRAFEGKSQASLIASILTAQPPPISSTRRARRADGLPEALDHVVDRCLAKSPDSRWQTAADLKAELEWIATTSGARRLGAADGTRRHVSRMLVVGVTAAAILAGAAGLYLGTRQRPADVTRFVVALPAGTTIAGGRDAIRLAASPDGRQLAFVATTEGREQIWVQSLGSVTPRVLDGTEGAMSPFWSPDSRFIGFFAPSEGELKKVEASGGPPRSICTALISGLPAWHRDGTILFTEFRRGLYRVSAEGGTPTPVTRVDQAQGELNHYWPTFLPDGRRFLYTATRLDASGRRATPIVYAASLDSNERTEVTRIHSRMVYSPPGRVLYVHEGALLAQAFDSDALRLTGEPVRVADGIDYYRSTGNAAFSVSEAGVLAYHGSAAPLSLVWFDRSGRPVGSVWNRQRFGGYRLSPDGEQVALEVVDTRLGTSDIWIYHLSRGVATRFTTDLHDESFPLWSPDGQRIVFGSDRGTGKDAASDFFVKAVDGTTDEELLFVQVGFQAPQDWSPNGRSIAFVDDNRETGNDVWLLALDGDRKSRPFLRTRFEEEGARFSPDSAWAAFVSDESGTFEVYIASANGLGGKTRISTGGGISPRWRRDGRELFYLSGDGSSVMAVPVELTPSFKAGVPARLFTLTNATGFRGRARNMAYDVAPDGQRFLMSVAAPEGASSRITVVLNWASELAR